MNHRLITALLTGIFSLTCYASAQAGALPTKKSTDALPKCTDPLPTVAVPNAPHGLFVILFPGARVNAQANILLHNPAVCGANFYLVWKEIDRGPSANPRYDWSSVDRQIAPWVAAKKRVNFIIWATTYQKGDSATPEYVFAKVPSVTCPSFGHVPVFWNPGFMQSYQAFMRAVVDHFANNPSVGYIRFGLGAGGEVFPACMHFMRDQGFSDSTWQKYIFDMLDFQKGLNSPKQLAVGINAYGEPPHLDFAAAVAARAAQDGIAIGNQGLTASDPRNDADGKPCMANWCKIFREHRTKVPLVLQTGHPTEPDRSGEIGSLVDMLPFAVEQKVQIFELYPQDWLVAYDQYNPAYPRHHEEYQKVIEDAAKILGGN
ncbi:MAG TPA: hypothetical protein VMH04_09285 [Candidatus Solibacter sp.]|nr:hypothetical protein [Candidatus Solibacter sp.]